MAPEDYEATAQRLRSVARTFVVGVCLGGLPVLGAVGAAILGANLRDLLRHATPSARRWLAVSMAACAVTGAANLANIRFHPWPYTVMTLAAGVGIVTYLCAMVDWTASLGWQWPLERWRRATWLASSMVATLILAFVVARVADAAGFTLGIGGAVLGVATLWAMTNAQSATESSMTQAAEHYRRRSQPSMS